MDPQPSRTQTAISSEPPKTRVGHPFLAELSTLQKEFPGFFIWLAEADGHMAFVAKRRHPEARPHTIVTDDPAELRAAITHDPVRLTNETAPPPGEFPQAIADDFPGWRIRRRHGVWEAWCPATTLHAHSASGLRSAIEREIAGDDE